MGLVDDQRVSEILHRVVTSFLNRYEPWLVENRLDSPTSIPGIRCGVFGLAYAFAALSRTGVCEGYDCLGLAERLVGYARAEAISLEFPEGKLDDLRSAFFHSDAGRAWTDGFISSIRGNSRRCQRSLVEFLSYPWQEARSSDIVLGQAGWLLATIGLFERLDTFETQAILLQRAKETAKILWTSIAHGSVRERSPFEDLNFAHGWTGVLYALLRYSEIVDDEYMAKMHGLIDELVEEVMSDGKGGRILPHIVGGTIYGTTGWCHGAAGQTFFLAGCPPNLSR